MTKDRLQNWLGRQVALFNLVKAERRLYDTDDTEFTYEYSMSQGNGLALDNIERVAELLGIKLTVRDRKDEDYPTELSFEYNGVTFYALSEKDVDFYTQYTQYEKEVSEFE